METKLWQQDRNVQKAENKNKKRFPHISVEYVEVVYQPKYNSLTGRIVGAEALVRCYQGGKLLPLDKIIAYLEHKGLIKYLDELVIESVCKLQKILMDLTLKIPISVNVSRKNLCRNKMATEYSAIFKEYNIPQELIPLEITETVDAEDKVMSRYAKRLIAQGFVLQMDDFGSAYASLNNFAEIGYKTVKLDKKLIDNIGNPKGDILLQYLIACFKNLNLDIVAEGVETEQQLQFLKDQGVTNIQGYYYSFPVQEAEFKRMLLRQLGV